MVFEGHITVNIEIVLCS